MQPSDNGKKNENHNVVHQINQQADQQKTARLEMDRPNVLLVETTARQAKIARLKGYEGDPCLECGQFTLVRNGSCLKCISCGSTTGCS